jgi:hypothetical protein
MGIRGAGLVLSEACAIVAAIIAFFAIQTPGPIQMMLFLWGVAALVLFGSILYLVLSITEYLGPAPKPRTFSNDSLSAVRKITGIACVAALAFRRRQVS